jgi:hypothetical protein
MPQLCYDEIIRGPDGRVLPHPCAVAMDERPKPERNRAEINADDLPSFEDLFPGARRVR